MGKKEVATIDIAKSVPIVIATEPAYMYKRKVWNILYNHMYTISDPCRINICF